MYKNDMASKGFQLTTKRFLLRGLWLAHPDIATFCWPFPFKSYYFDQSLGHEIERMSKLDLDELKKVCKRLFEQNSLKF